MPPPGSGVGHYQIDLPILINTEAYEPELSIMSDNVDEYDDTYSYFANYNNARDKFVVEFESTSSFTEANIPEVFVGEAGDVFNSNEKNSVSSKPKRWRFFINNTSFTKVTDYVIAGTKVTFTFEPTKENLRSLLVIDNEKIITTFSKKIVESNGTVKQLASTPEPIGDYDITAMETTSNSSAYVSVPTVLSDNENDSNNRFYEFRPINIAYPVGNVNRSRAYSTLTRFPMPTFTNLQDSVSLVTQYTTNNSGQSRYHVNANDDISISSGAILMETKETFDFSQGKTMQFQCQGDLATYNLAFDFGNGVQTLIENTNYNNITIDTAASTNTSLKIVAVQDLTILSGHQLIVNNLSGAEAYSGMFGMTSWSRKDFFEVFSVSGDGSSTEAAATSGVDFVLTALNSEMTTSLFSLVAEGAVEDVLDAKYKHDVALSVSADEWNNVFWLAPQSDTNDPDGLPNATALYDIDIFEEEVIKYHTKKDNMSTANLNYSNTTNAALQAGTFSIESNTMPTSEACIKAWSKDIFQQEKMDDIWNNRATVKGEINEYITSTASDSTKNLLEQLKVIVNNADGLTNLDTGNVKENLTRQLLLQLHKAVAGNGEEGEARLLNGAGGIFEASNQTHTDGDDKYYAFLFKPNDTLTFGMTIKHPDQYRTAGADGANMLEDNQSNNRGAFDGGAEPRDMDFKITITMT